MTYSIVTRCNRTGRLGVASATAHFAVGALVPHARAGTGALATQAATNPLYGPDGLDLLSGGADARAVVAALTGADSGRQHRQLIVVDRDGGVAAWTGAETVAWAGHHLGAGYAVAGNMLAGPAVIQAMSENFEGAPADIDLPGRLLMALMGGEAAGGDKRGRQSAALYVVDTQAYPLVDLRVDHSRNPVDGLVELLAEWRKPYVTTFRERLPVR